MSSADLSRHLDVSAFARQQGELGGKSPLAHFTRLLDACEVQGEPGELTWRLRGFERASVDGSLQPWLHLSLEASLPLSCQRCLATMDASLNFSGEYRFVADEASAQAEDDQSDEDVLSLERPLDLLALVEDELIMALPIVPKHQVCGAALNSGMALEGGEDPLPHPFAALAAFKKAP